MFLDIGESRRKTPGAVDRRQVSEQQPEPGDTREGPAMAAATGRALIGWLTAAQGQLTLAGRRADKADAPEHVERARLAREAVAARAPGVDQTDAVRDV